MFKNQSNNLILTQSLAGLSQWLDIFLIFTAPVYIWNATPAEMAFIALIFGLPSLFLGPFVGAYLDRVNPFYSMVMGSLLRVVTSLLVIFAFNIETFGLLILLKGIANLIYGASGTIMTNHIVEEDNRVNFFSLFSTVDQIIKIGTPLVAGLLVLNTSYTFAFITSAIFSGLCTVSLVMIGKNYTYKESTNKRSINMLFLDVMQGFTSLNMLHPNLRLTILLSIGMSLSLALYDPHLAAFFKSSGLAETAYSLVVSFTGLGAVVGALSLKLWFSNTRSMSLITCGLSFFMLSLLLLNSVIYAFSSYLSEASIAFIWFLNGLGYELFIIGSIVNMQNLCPKDSIGKITTSVRSLKMTCVVLGPVLGASFIHFDRKLPFFISLILTVTLMCFLVIGAKRFKID